MQPGRPYSSLPELGNKRWIRNDQLTAVQRLLLWPGPKNMLVRLSSRKSLNNPVPLQGSLHPTGEDPESRPPSMRIRAFTTKLPDTVRSDVPPCLGIHAPGYSPNNIRAATHYVGLLPIQRQAQLVPNAQDRRPNRMDSRDGCDFGGVMGDLDGQVIHKQRPANTGVQPFKKSNGRQHVQRNLKHGMRTAGGYTHPAVKWSHRHIVRRDHEPWSRIRGHAHLQCPSRVAKLPRKGNQPRPAHSVEEFANVHVNFDNTSPSAQVKETSHELAVDTI
jgi:hypothetical protein